MSLNHFYQNKMTCLPYLGDVPIVDISHNCCGSAYRSNEVFVNDAGNHDRTHNACRLFIHVRILGHEDIIARSNGVDHATHFPLARSCRVG